MQEFDLKVDLNWVKQVLNVLPTMVDEMSSEEVSSLLRLLLKVVFASKLYSEVNVDVDVCHLTVPLRKLVF